MFNNYLKSGLRFLRHNKVFAAINLFGLSIALAASFILLLYVLSYDHDNKNRNRVLKVLNYYVDFKKVFDGTPYILAPSLKEEFPQVIKSVRVGRFVNFRLKLKDEYIDVPRALGTDSEIFDIFTIPLISGSTDKNLLDDMNSIVLSH